MRLCYYTLTEVSSWILVENELNVVIGIKCFSSNLILLAMRFHLMFVDVVLFLFVQVCWLPFCFISVSHPSHLMCSVGLMLPW